MSLICSLSKQREEGVCSHDRTAPAAWSLWDGIHAQTRGDAMLVLLQKFPRAFQISSKQCVHGQRTLTVSSPGLCGYGAIGLAIVQMRTAQATYIIFIGHL